MKNSLKNRMPQSTLGRRLCLGNRALPLSFQIFGVCELGTMGFIADGLRPLKVVSMPSRVSRSGGRRVNFVVIWLIGNELWRERGEAI